MKKNRESPDRWLAHNESTFLTWLAGKDWRQKERGQQRMRWWDCITYAMDLNLSKLQEIVADRGAWCVTVLGATKRRTRLHDQTAIAWMDVDSYWSLQGSRGWQGPWDAWPGDEAQPHPLFCIPRSSPGCGQLPPLLPCWDRWPSPVLLSLWGQTFGVFHFLLFAIESGRCSHSHISE